jgi:hypothetical protein
MGNLEACRNKEFLVYIRALALHGRLPLGQSYRKEASVKVKV